LHCYCRSEHSFVAVAVAVAVVHFVCRYSTFDLLPIVGHVDFNSIPFCYHINSLVLSEA
jgi:hypothetical protein